MDKDNLGEYLISVTLLCITLVYSLRLAFHSTFQCQIAEANSTGGYHFLNDPYELDLVLSSVSLGLFIGTIPLVVLNRFSTRKIISIFCSIAVFSGLLFPTVSNNFYLSYFDRVVQGIPCSVLLWVVGAVSYEWAPRRELALASAIISSVYQLAPCLTMVLSAEMCVSVGWQYTYYVLSIATTLVICLFWVLYRNDVKHSRWVSPEERADIMKGKGERTKIHAPIGRILQDPQVWMIWFVYYTYFSAMYTFLQYAPLFLNEVAGLSVRVSGWSAAVPHLLSLFLKVVMTGYANVIGFAVYKRDMIIFIKIFAEVTTDKIPKITFAFGMCLDRLHMGGLACRMKIGFVAVELAAAGALAPLFVVTPSTSLYLFSYICFNSFNSIAVIVIMKHMSLMSGPHMHFLCNVCTWIAVIVVPSCSFAKTIIAPDDTSEQWLHLFALMIIQLIISVVLYTTFGKPVRAKWAEIPAVIETKEQKLLLDD